MEKNKNRVIKSWTSNEGRKFASLGSISVPFRNNPAHFWVFYDKKGFNSARFEYDEYQGKEILSLDSKSSTKSS